MLHDALQRNYHTFGRFITSFGPIIIAVIAGILLCGTMPGSASAGAIAPCSDPLVFEGANVNIVILPYTYTGHANMPLSKAGQKLSLLIQMNSLFTMLKYGSIGVTALMATHGEENECRHEEVMDKILGKWPSSSMIRPKKGVAVLWGRIYEEGEDIYVQSYLSFLRRDMQESVQLNIYTQQESLLGFSGKLPSQSFAFAPRKLTKRDLDNMGREFEKSAVVRIQPQETSEGNPLSLDSYRPFAYQVTEAKQDWMRIVSLTGGPSGWVKAHIDSDTWSLQRFLPELDFLNAVVGYLQYRIANESGSKSRIHEIAGWVKKALFSYHENSGTERTALPTAVGKIMQGMLEILEDGPKLRAVSVEKANRLFVDAISLIPYSGDARNLAVVTRIYLCCDGKKPLTNTETIIADLTDALMVEPRNADVLANLENFYILLNSYKDIKIPFDKSELARRLQAVQEVRASLKGAQNFKTAPQLLK